MTLQYFVIHVLLYKYFMLFVNIIYNYNYVVNYNWI